MVSGNKKQPLFQVLSLDVVLGSLAVGFFAVTILDVQPNPWWWFILPAAVWVVYTLDHLIDGFKKKDDSTIYRHRFHYQNRKLLGTLAALIGIIAGLVSIIYLQREIVFWGIALAFFTVVYFALHSLIDKLNLKYFPKEFFIAFVYITGIFLAPLVWYGSLPSYPIILVITFLFLLAWMESVIISYFDFENDLADGFKSFTISFGKKEARKFIILILTVISILIVLFVFVCANQFISFALFIEFLISMILLFLILFPEKFKRDNRFRWIGEGVFYLPVLISFTWIFN